MLFRLIIAAFIIALAVAVSPQGVIADDNAPSQNKEKQEQLNKLRNMQGASPWKNKDQSKPEAPRNPASEKRQPKFQVDWKQSEEKGFGDILELETDPIEYREGNSPTYHKTKQPALTKYSNVTLKRGIWEGNFEHFELWKKTFMFENGRDVKLLNKTPQNQKPLEQKPEDK